ncbi:hypothetical protein OCU04_011263 [Sclerotinia nivalis]|uniref:Aminoglycoside phosphotransferase domain-containing protein n=1 Tax=Sclerotinia nivalis TaxID=352851 RepID=A0A9X0AEW8_9HELO|nr:hypothetical protein OCU04_011263 [Sclerotinia nivalis]
MLSETWNEFRHCEVRKTNLFRDLSRIMLSLSQSPLPRIESWTLDSNGILQLSNRPLTLRLQQLENEGISTNIDRSLTYSATDAYYLDLLSCHDSRIRHQPNSLNDESDGRAQMANLTIMRSLLSHFTNREFRHGPLILRLTDLHQSNIFVDDDWNIKCLIDLEWACSLPVETMRPPYWLTGCPADDLVGQNIDSFSKAQHEFMEVFEEEEKSFPPGNNVPLYRTNIMRKRKGWKIGNLWYFQALDSSKGLYNIFLDHIQPIFAPSHNIDPDFSRIVSEYWAVGVNDIISAKLQDKDVYERMLRQKFENVSSNS